MSGSCRHMFQYRSDCTPIQIADNNVIHAAGKGKLRVRFKLPGGSSRNKTIDVLHVPALGKTNLWSVKKGTKGGQKMIFNESRVELRNRYDVLTAIGEVDDENMYKLHIKAIPSVSALPAKATSQNQLRQPALIDMNLAHNRIIHRNLEDIIHMQNCTEGLILLGKRSSACFCEACALGKSHRKPFPKIRKLRTKELCEVVWFDTCGLLKGMTHDGKEHFITFIEDMTRRKETYLMWNKSQAFSKFKIFKARIENLNRTKNQYCTCRTMQKNIFHKSFWLFLKMKEFSGNQISICFGTNLAEPGHGVIMDAARSMIQRECSQKHFWAFPILTATQVLNLCPHPNDKSTTPHQQMTGSRPNISYLRVFGLRCICTQT